MTISDEVFAPDAAHHTNLDERHDAAHVVPDEHYGERQEGQNQRGPPAPVLGQLLRVAEVAKRLSMGKSTILRYVTLGKFPAPFKNPTGANVWTESVIDEYIGRLMAERDAKEAKK